MKNHQIKSHIWIFVNALIENPAFDSQTKENHTLAVSKFGSKAELGPKFLKDVAKSGIIDNILVWAKVRTPHHRHSPQNAPPLPPSPIPLPSQH
jgi:DNA topoisomerase-2